MVYCIGETVLDLIFTNDLNVRATPGGSMLNAAVSLGRVGVEVELISEIPDDLPGNFVVGFLQKNGVGTRYVRRIKSCRTTLALAFLEENSDANYTFYADPVTEIFKGKFPDPGPEDIILFGSYFSLTDRVHQFLSEFLSLARQNLSLVIYDPNFRAPHLPVLKRVYPLIMENMNFADLVKGSYEDFLHIFATDSPGEVYRIISEVYSPVLIRTNAGKDIVVIKGGHEVIENVPPLLPLSTVGAGDSFNAGIIFFAVRNRINKERLYNLSISEWPEMIRTGIKFAADVCKSYENYISNDLAKELNI